MQLLSDELVKDILAIAESEIKQAGKEIDTDKLLTILHDGEDALINDPVGYISSLIRDVYFIKD